MNALIPEPRHALDFRPPPHANVSSLRDGLRQSQPNPLRVFEIGHDPQIDASVSDEQIGDFTRQVPVNEQGYHVTCA